MKTKTKSISVPKLFFAGGAVLMCLAVPAVSSSYMLRVFNMAMIAYLCVLSVYVLLGMCGQNSFAQAGFWGTALFAFVLGFAFFRLRQYYFTFASVGLMTILNGLFMNWTEFTGGALGLSNIPAFSVGSFSLESETWKYVMILPVCVLASLLMKVLFRSSLGRSFMAIRDNEMAANCLGVNSLLTKSIAFAISGALCGAAGALYAFLSGYLSYQSFTYQQSTMYLIMIMLGGTASPTGAIIGTLIISLLQEWVRPLQNYMQLIYGAGIMILMIVQPEGILGGGKAFYEKHIKRKKAYTPAE